MKRAPGAVRVDWAEIHRRLDRAEQSLAQGDLPPERVAALLAERARALAATPSAAEPPVGRTRSVLTFTCAGGLYGLDAARAREILPLASLTRVPRAAPHWAGLTSRRGELLLVLDLALMLGLPVRGIADLTKVIVLEGRGGELGILAQAVEGIREVDLGRVGPPVGDRRYVEGIADGPLALLDVEALLEHCELDGPAGAPP